MSVLAICPSRQRPEQARAILDSFLATRADEASRLLFVVDADDPTVDAYPREWTTVVAPTGCMGGAIRSVMTRDVLRDATTVGFVGDDNRFRTPAWDVILDEWCTENIGIAYGDDLLQHERLPTSWWIARPLIDAFGLMGHPFRHLYIDNWWKSLGEAAGCLRYFPEVIIEHLHPLAGKAKDDAIYQRGSQPRNIANDRMHYRQWERRGKAADVERVRKIRRRNERRRVLADWHHPALYESLAILFEDRFGWELYSPTGMDWTEHGWSWSFPAAGWEVERFLVFDDLARVDGHFERREPEYPDRPRKLVTWPQALELGFDYVLDSLPPHQRSFGDLARQFGAMPIHQVGNARHQIPRLGGVVLASVNTAARPNVVRYHQPFDLGLFGPGLAQDREAVASFMLRLDTTSGPYAFLGDAGLDWTSYGGVSPDDPGYLAPMAKVAEAMRRVGWIWHDKKIGDGYGHVLWTAAAMGRPLIGHASYFRGQLGEPLWRDLETCIDLDRHSPETVVRLIRAISRDEMWQAMSDEMTATFARLVDFEAEAAAIRTALDR